MSSEGMSSEQLRAHLFRSLQGSGVVDSLKVGNIQPAYSYLVQTCACLSIHTHTEDRAIISGVSLTSLSCATA